MYKVIGLIFKYLFRNKIYVYQRKGEVDNFEKQVTKEEKRKERT